MSTSESAAQATPKVTNLRDTRKEMAATRKRHPAGSEVPAKKAPAKKPASVERKAPTTSGKAKLRWDGEVANVNVDGKKIEIGRLVKRANDTYDTVVQINEKATVLATGMSKDGAYKVVVDFHHRGTRPEAKKTATPKAAS